MSFAKKRYIDYKVTDWCHKKNKILLSRNYVSLQILLDFAFCCFSLRKFALWSNKHIFSLLASHKVIVTANRVNQEDIDSLQLHVE
jgi:hypothetical protein